MKRLILSACVLATTLFNAPVFAVFANCSGGPAMQTCTDNSGNSYTDNRFGNTTMAQGYNRGSE